MSMRKNQANTCMSGETMMDAHVMYDKIIPGITGVLRRAAKPDAFCWYRPGHRGSMLYRLPVLSIDFDPESRTCPFSTITIAEHQGDVSAYRVIYESENIGRQGKVKLTERYVLRPGSPVLAWSLDFNQGKDPSEVSLPRAESTFSPEERKILEALDQEVTFPGPYDPQGLCDRLGKIVTAAGATMGA